MASGSGDSEDPSQFVPNPGDPDDAAKALFWSYLYSSVKTDGKEYIS